MKHTRHNVDTDLDRLLGRHNAPGEERMRVAIDRARERLRTHSETTLANRSPDRRASKFGWRAGILAVVAVVGVVVAVTVPRKTEWLATVEAADGSRYTLAPDSLLRSGESVGTSLTLKDGSRLEMRAHSDLSLARATDGVDIHLTTGGLVVNGATQHDQHLYVRTKDMTIAVTGTTVIVNADNHGSRVSVIDGNVRVREGRSERTVRPGEQVSTTPEVATGELTGEAGWSPRVHAILATFDKGMASTGVPITPATQTATASAIGTAQAAESEFEAASIRQCDPDHLPQSPDGGRGGGANSFYLMPGRLRALCMTMAALIRTAYGYLPQDSDFDPDSRMEFETVYNLGGAKRDRRIRGGPEWIRSEQYTVEAVTRPGVTPSVMDLRGPMLRRLLERRLQMKAHIEREQAPAYALTVARGGLRIKPVTSEACDERPAPGSGLNVRPPRHVADVRLGQKPWCGISDDRNGPNVAILGGHVSLEELPVTLGFELGGVRVLNRTGINDRFNFILEFVRDDNTPGLGRRNRLPEPAAESDVPAAATIFSALDEQLGLKLERVQVPREFIVVDHVERPTEK